MPQHTDACDYWQARFQRGELKVKYSVHAANFVRGVDPADIVPCGGHDDELCTGADDCACECPVCAEVVRDKLP